MQIAGAREPPGEHRGDPRVQVGLPRERGIERLELLGRLHQQRRSVSAAASGERDLPAQQGSAGPLELIQRPAIAMVSRSADRQFGPLTAVDDHGARYQTELRGVHAATLLVLRPDPPHQIRWLDLTTAPGEPATRIDLDPLIPAPDVTVTRDAQDPGELLLDVIAVRILCSGAAAVPQDDLVHPPAGAAGLRAFIGDGPGRIVAAQHASGALPPASPVPGQLAALCTLVGIPGRGITAPPAADLPEPWHSMLTRPRRPPQARPAPGIASGAVAELPELDGAHITILGLHHATIHGLHHSETQPSCTRWSPASRQRTTWTYDRVVRPLPALWARDSSGRWHATRTHGVGPSPNSAEVIVWLQIMPRWAAAPRGSMWSPPADRPRSGSGCRCAGRETPESDP